MAIKDIFSCPYVEDNQIILFSDNKFVFIKSNVNFNAMSSAILLFNDNDCKLLVIYKNQIDIIIVYLYKFKTVSIIRNMSD